MSDYPQLRKKQFTIFAIGWIAYASTYFLRKPVGVIKVDLESNLGFTKVELGWLDTALLLPYAVMQMLLGPLGDKFGARRTLAMCLFLSGLSMVTFGMWRSIYVFMLLLFLNGTAQAQCWPNCVKALGAWFPDKVRSSVFGMFGTCAFSGGIGGTYLAVALQHYFGWENIFWGPSLFVMVMGFVVLVQFFEPSELNVEVPGKAETANSKGSKENIPMLEVLKIPMLKEVAFAVFCLKTVRYCMYMWLPMYLLRALKYSKLDSGMFSTVFEIGGVIGSALIGFVIDRVFKGKSILGTFVFSLLSAVSLVLFLMTSSWGVTFNMTFLFLAGFFNCGPDSILGGSVPAELGEMNGKNAAAAATGLVNGFGSVGTVLEGPIIGFVSAHYSWSGMFLLMIIVSFLGSASVFKAAAIQRSRSIVQKLPEEEPLDPSLV